MEHRTFHKILQNRHIIGYFCYVDDILLIFDKTITDINQVLNEFNTATPSLPFTVEHESDNKINFLDLTIKKDDGKFSFEIYRKPTCTDIIIPHDSCHPTEQKLSAIRYLHNRNNTYLTDDENKQKEQTIINQILHNNQYNQLSTTKYTRQKPSTHIHNRKQVKWA
jgi:regulator of PEP synthase PpsR (kinase-PPPase family)